MTIEPTKKQSEFLSSNADICLFAGGAGSGKSFCILIDALGLNDSKFGPRISLPFYRALIYRKQFKHLSDLVDKSWQLYPRIDSGAEYTSTNLTWTFSSGAKIQFGYFEEFSQVESIQGRELHYIACDELGQFADDRIMRYCLSRLRSSQGLKCYYRATSNPSRYRWIRDTFKIGPLGESTKFFVETPLKDGTISRKKIQYIQAKLSDNPYLGNDYEAQLMLLPEDEREALLNGNWLAYSNVEGSIYKKQLKLLYEDNRYCVINCQKTQPIFAAFDLGIGDNTSCIVFQIIGKERHIIESFENSDENIHYYIQKLQEKGYEKAHIILPHDSKQRSLETGKTICDIFCETFREVTVLERLGIEDGINFAKINFENVWIDSRNNIKLVECLTGYHRKHDPVNNIFTDPVHDINSHFADCFRYFMSFTPKVKIVLKSILKTSRPMF